MKPYWVLLGTAFATLATAQSTLPTSSATPLTAVTTAENAPATAATTRAAAPALDSPEAALHELLVGMFTGNQEQVNHATLEVPGRELLTQGQKVPAGMVAQLEKVITGLNLQRLKLGDSIKVKTTSSPEGVTVVMDENHINEKRTEITGPTLPFPFILVRVGEEWKVDPGPLIASRKSAMAAQSRAAGATKPAESVPASRP